MSVVGIDFGTSKCVVVAIHSGEVKVVVNEVSNRKTPTYVGYGDKHRYLGESALSRVASNFTNTIPGVVLKKMIGKRLDSRDVQEVITTLPLSFSADEEGRVLVEVEHDEQKISLGVESAAAALFGHLKKTAEGYLNTIVSDCVIGVPSFWTDVQRRALIDAAKIGGFHVLGLMNETSAVALQYGLLRSLPKEKTTRVLFFDLGYAHLNTAIVNLKEGELSVAGCYTDPNLGGRNFDLLLAEHMASHIATTAKLDVKTNRKAWIRVQKEAENVKKVLSANSDTHWGIECLMDDKDVKGVVTRPELEAVAAPLLEKIGKAVERLLQICKLTVKDIDSVEVVGGSVRIPCVISKLESFLGMSVSRTCDGDESVGRGCALMSAMLSPKFKVLDFKVNDISPYPIEIVHGPVGGAAEGVSVIFEQFNPTPSVKAMTFKRDEPLEISFRYRDMQFLPEATDSLISTYRIAGIPKGAEDKPKLKIKMKLDVSGIVSVPSATLMEEYWVEEVVKPTPKPETPAANAAEQPKAESADANAAQPEAQESTEDLKMDTAPDDENQMDTTPDNATPTPAADAPASEAKAPEPQIIKKKKTRKVELPIESVVYGALSKNKFQAAVDLEMKQALQDKTVLYTLARKNDLEAFIYDIRDKVQYEALETATEEAKTAFLALVDQAEDWLYNEGYDALAADYVDRLVSLRKASNPLLVPPVVEAPPAEASREESANPASSPENQKGDSKSAPQPNSEAERPAETPVNN